MWASAVVHELSSHSAARGIFQDRDLTCVPCPRYAHVNISVHVTVVLSSGNMGTCQYTPEAAAEPEDWKPRLMS